MSASEAIKTKLLNSISLKLLVILFLVIIMQIPLSLVSDLINERQSLLYVAQKSISDRWGEQQHIGTPLIKIKLQASQSKEDKALINYHTIQSDQANFEADLQAEKRYLGIYEAAIYVTKLKLTGQIKVDSDVYYGGNEEVSVQLFIPFKHLRGLKNIDKIMINGQEVTDLPKKQQSNQMMGFAIDLQRKDIMKPLTYQIHLSVAGSQQFDILPLAKSTTVTMQSNWNSPSFVGDYLPDERAITEKGFNAKWHINQLNNDSHSSSRFLTDQQYSSFGVKIMIPANVYQVNVRTVKYSFLVIVLTFAGFFLTELFFKLSLHPFQYLLIGFSLSTFYLLLLSLSEYLSFNWSFLISASAIVGLISGYCSVVLQQTKRGLLTGILFSILYGFIFILVKAEEASLLMGSIAILLILATVMYLTRKIDWYAAGTSNNTVISEKAIKSE